MKIPELLSEIYTLLLQENRGRASDLLTEFMLAEGITSGVNLGKIGELSKGTPEEMVSRLRNILAEQVLVRETCVNSIDSHELNDDDFNLINANARILEARAVYGYDEEDDLYPSSLSASPVVSGQLRHNPLVDLLSRENEQLTVVDEEEDAEDEDDDDEDIRIDDDHDQYFGDTSIIEIDDEGNDDEWKCIEGEEDFDDYNNGRGTLEDIELIDDLFLQGNEPQGTGSLVDDLADYFGIDEEDELDDIDFGERRDFEDIDTSERLNREERARQVAIQVGVKFGWDRSGIDLLSEIFEEHGWGPARIAVEQMIEEGITEDSLQLVKDMKDLWEGNDVYGLAFLRLGNRTGYCTYHGGRTLSWKMAKKITNLFPNGDISEVECFLEKAFDAWYDNIAVTYRFPVFLNFIKNVITEFDSERSFPGVMFYVSQSIIMHRVNP